MWEIEPTLITFVIPTIGRNSLNKAVESLLYQPDWNWKCIIVFDGVEPISIPCIDYQNDNHFTVLKIDRKGSAGLVRNEAFKHINTEWVGFLDDDDYLANTYLARFKEYISDNSLDIVVFSYKDVSNGNIQPPLSMRQIVRCNVGISFAVKRKFTDMGVRFQAQGIEDYQFLKDCVDLGAKYKLTGDIQYFVSKRGVWQKE